MRRKRKHSGYEQIEDGPTLLADPSQAMPSGGLPVVSEMTGEEVSRETDVASLADQLVARAEESRVRATTTSYGSPRSTVEAIVYVGDAILALTERLTELEQ